LSVVPAPTSHPWWCRLSPVPQITDHPPDWPCPSVRVSTYLTASHFLSKVPSHRPFVCPGKSSPPCAPLFPPHRRCQALSCPLRPCVQALELHLTAEELLEPQRLRMSSHFMMNSHLRKDMVCCRSTMLDAVSTMSSA
jgi:hypothetical protein